MFGEIIKQKRIKLGLTQQEVADQLHVTRQTVSNWENAKSYPDIPILINISNYYSLSLDYMLKGDADFMKKVENDYQMIESKRRKRWVTTGMVICIILMVILIIAALIIKDSKWNNWLAVAIAAVCLPLIVLTYFQYKSFFKKQPKGTPQPLFIPKMFGVGVSINPNHPIGKLIWVVLFLFIAGLLVYTIISIP